MMHMETIGNPQFIKPLWEPSWAILHTESKEGSK